METRHMGFKKTFAYYDFWDYFDMMFILVFIVGCSLQLVIYFILSVVTGVIAIFTKQDFAMLNQLFGWIIMMIGPALILFIFRKHFYYEIVKHNMQNGYNFVINPNGIELLVKKEEPVIIDINEIESVNLSMYHSITRKYFDFQYFRFIGTRPDSNFRKDSINIEIILKKDVALTKFKRKGFYYKLFNYRVNKKTNQAKFYLYEIMYDNQYKNDMVVFHEYFGDLIKTS